jgi:phosphopantetheinyl transferase
MRHVGDREVRADLELTFAGRVWARIDGWEDRRFDSDDAVWDVLMYPERHALAVAQPGGYVVAREHWAHAASRELMMRRYLGEAERAAYEAMPPRSRRSWLLGRIAVKDAVRMHRWRAGGPPSWPVEVTVGNDAEGRPFADEAGFAARGGGTRLSVSVAHKDDVAVAIVDDARAVGIDIERIEARPDSFLRVAFTPAELALCARGDADHARLWAAKEAVGKARGTGVTDPRRLEVHADGERLMIGDAVIDTHFDGDTVVAWTRLGGRP